MIAKNNVLHFLSQGIAWIGEDLFSNTSCMAGTTANKLLINMNVIFNTLIVFRYFQEIFTGPANGDIWLSNLLSIQGNSMFDFFCIPATFLTSTCENVIDIWYIRIGVYNSYEYSHYLQGSFWRWALPLRAGVPMNAFSHSQGPYTKWSLI